MLIILPLLTFLLVVFDLLGLHSRRQGQLPGLRAVILESIAFMGGYMVLFSEGLSLFRLLDTAGAGFCWGIALIAAGLLGWRKGWIVAGARVLQARRNQVDWFDLTAGILMFGTLGLLFFIAVISPSNNNDSLYYHMSRVMHWAQDRSLAHYPTGYEHQLYNPIFAELSILNARLLWGTDRLANLIQWGSLVVGILGSSVLARLLGARKRGQWLAALFTLSLPIAILQATSTQNDLVVGAWLIGLLFFILLARQRNLAKDETVALSLSLGLGLLTKGTFYAYAILPGVYFSFLLFKKMGLRKAFITLAAVVGMVIILNLGYWLRNWNTFGTPLGSTEFISTHADLRPSFGTYLGSIVRNVVENFATPSDAVNTKIVDGLKAAFKPIDPVMNNFNIIWAWNQEDYAGAPLHMLLVPATLVLLFLLRRKLKADVLPYTVLATGLFVSLSVVVGNILSASRFQIAFFIAWGAVFGIAIEALGKKWLTTAGVMLLLLATIPWVVFNRTRPLIAMRPSHDPFTIPCLAGCTAGSILNEPPVRVLFAERPDLQEPYTLATNAIRQASCRAVGLQLDSHDYEYNYWWLLDAPQNGTRLETIYTLPELERYLDPTFKPCAILCTICRGKTHLHGLPLISDYTGFVQLYMGPDYSPDADK
jgi:hypothetical protein